MNLWRKFPAPTAPQPRPAAPLAARSYAARPAPSRPWLHALLFALTLASMTACGARLQGVNPFASLRHFAEGISFSGTLLAILTVHEFGHYFAARRWGVSASLPFFIPFPLFLGTLGALIKIRSPIPDKRALMDIGAAGPLAGLVASLALCIIGLSQSSVVQLGNFDPPPIQLGTPLLFSGLSALILPELGPDQMVLLTPVAFAGWVGLFITAFNLFPVGQLDGGHIVYALFSGGHRWIARGMFAVLLSMGVYGILSLAWGWPQGWPGWLILALLLTIFGVGHPPPHDPGIPLDPRRRRLGYLCLIIFALCFTPVPFNA